MRLSFHPATQRDVNDIMDHYRQVSGDPLAGRFYTELMERLNDVAKGAWIGNAKLPVQRSHSASSAMPVTYR